MWNQWIQEQYPLFWNKGFRVILLKNKGKIATDFNGSAVWEDVTVQVKIKLTGFLQRFKESFWTCCLQSKKVNIPLAALSLPYPPHLQLSLLLWASASNPDDLVENPLYQVTQSASPWGCPFPPDTACPSVFHPFPAVVFLKQGTMTK